MSAHCTSTACKYTLAHTVDWCRPTRPESLEERLARIRATVDGVDPSADFALKRADVRWLLSQVSGERVWMVEMVTVENRLGPDHPSARWFPALAHPFPRREMAEHYLLSVNEVDRPYYRITSAPRQVWTPEEEK